MTTADGQVTQVMPDGTTLTKAADGTKTQIMPNGIKLIVRPDGTKQQTNADGSVVEIDVTGKQTFVGSSAGGAAAPAAPAAPGSPAVPRGSKPTAPSRASKPAAPSRASKPAPPVVPSRVPPVRKAAPAAPAASAAPAEESKGGDGGSARGRATTEYKVDSDLISEFSPAEVDQMKTSFRAFDADGNGSIDCEELKHVMLDLGEQVTETGVKELIASVDRDGSQTIEFPEFVRCMYNLRSGKAGGGAAAAAAAAAAGGAAGGSAGGGGGGGGGGVLAAAQSKFAGVVNTHYKKNIVKHKGKVSTGGSHSYSEDEVAAFTEHINHCLAGQHPGIPIGEGGLFAAVGDGIILCKLINAAKAGSVDERVLNRPKGGRPVNLYQKKENCNLAINAARSIGCVCVNVHNTDLIEGTPHIVLGVIWQIIKIQLLSMINLKEHPELVLLLEEGEELSDLLALSPEDLLLRWINYHLKNAGSDRRVKNFGKDLHDSEAYTLLLNQIAPSIGQTCGLEALEQPDLLDRASTVIGNARNNLGVPAFIMPPHIANGDKRLNLAFCAQLFNMCPGLTLAEQEKLDLLDDLDDDDGDDPREERIFRMWINSLGMEDVYINNLFEDLRDGVKLLKTMDKVEPGTVSWKKVNVKPKNKFKKVENGNYAVVLGKQLNFSLVGIGGIDVVDGNKKLILSVVWQLMRLHTLKMLSDLGGGGKISDRDVLNWANQTVAGSGKSSSISSFNDSSIGTSVFLIDLMAAIEPRAVNWDVVTAGRTDEERESNARLVINIARKIGCCVFLTWEDVVEVKSKVRAAKGGEALHCLLENDQRWGLTLLLSRPHSVFSSLLRTNRCSSFSSPRLCTWRCPASTTKETVIVILQVVTNRRRKSDPSFSLARLRKAHRASSAAFHPILAL